MMLCRHLLLQLACFILLMHTLVPHEHHDERLEEEHVCQPNQIVSFFDIFRLAFHSDIGEGHLDHFVMASQGSLQLNDWSGTDLSYHWAITELTIDHLDKNAKSLDTDDHLIIYSKKYTPFKARRGPPVMN